MKLERGINLGGYLSQCVHSTEHYDAFIQEEDIRKIDLSFSSFRNKHIFCSAFLHTGRLLRFLCTI